MKWEELNNYILNRYDDAELLFDLNNCYFEDQVIIDQIDDLDPFDKLQAIADYEMMGCSIKNNNVIVPARLPFLIRPSLKSDPTSYYIVRNGIDIGISWPDDLDIHIDLSDIGRKCKLIGQDLDINTTYDSMYKAYEHIKSIETVFGIHIINK